MHTLSNRIGFWYPAIYSFVQRNYRYNHQSCISPTKHLTSENENSQNDRLVSRNFLLPKVRAKQQRVLKGSRSCALRRKSNAERGRNNLFHTHIETKRGKARLVQKPPTWEAFSLSLALCSSLSVSRFKSLVTLSSVVSPSNDFCILSIPEMKRRKNIMGDKDHSTG